jgi:hypothetical protein
VERPGAKNETQPGAQHKCYGRHDAFFDRRNREVAQRYLEALHELVKLQILRSAGASEHYELTNVGWEISRKLS